MNPLASCNIIGVAVEVANRASRCHTCRNCELVDVDLLELGELLPGHPKVDLHLVGQQQV